MRLRGLTTSLATAALLLAAAPAASAATDVGNDCEASIIDVGATILPLSAPSDPLPISVPTAGIATQWKVRSIPGTDIHTERLKVFRPTADPLRFQVVAESGLEGTTGGLSTFNIRIPVQSGDRFGVTGKPGEGAVACASRPGDVEGILAGDPPVGSTPAFTENMTSQVAVVATVEPDKDGDGYGDETQDRCPQSATFQSECPRVDLNLVPIVGRRSMRLLITSNVSTSVSVSESRHRAGRYLGAARGPSLYSPSTPVSPGTITSIKLRFYRSMVETLKSLSPKRSMKLRLTVTAINLTGPPTTETLAVKVRGQKKPTHKR